jgi:fructokinase
LAHPGIDLGGTLDEASRWPDDGRESPAGAWTRRATTTARSPRSRARRPPGAAPARAGTWASGIPGAVTREAGLVKNANSTWLNGRPLGRDLEGRLGRPVRVMNDANCFALSEAADGAGAGADVVFGVILGTGVGGGVVVGGRCLVGPNLVAGEWGHNPLPWPADDERPGPACYCGRCGCVETFLSGPGLARDHEAHTGRALSTREIARAAADGDPGAAAAMARYEERLARALAAVVNVLDPDVVVLGGGMSNVPGLAGAAEAGLARWVFSDRVVTRVVRNVHGDSSGVRGAAWLWPAEARA